MPTGPIAGVNLRYPMPAFPRGWYSVCDSSELSAGEIKPIQALGEELVAVRSEDGSPRVFDAYCPHLGAHLAHGGEFVDGQLRCPFHHWRFSAEDGRCSAIPYAQRIPPNAALDSWPCEERNGLVMLYYDPDRAEPAWRVDEVAELADPQWIKVADLEWTMKTHMHEVLENVFDTAHIKYVHEGSEVPRIEQVEESPGKIDFAMRGDASDGTSDLDITLWGLGIQRLRYKLKLPVFELDTMLPLDEETVFARTRLYMKDQGSAELNQAIAGEIAKELDRQVQSDIQIFEHKKHQAEPLLCDGDGPIPVYRRWTEQFYR
jgi:nitrite reductase/ring-hydroxylating ferredoxin subunit